MSATEQRFRAVFLGPPGAGKGTQAKELVERQAVLHISTGDMLRQHRKDGTELGRRAKEFMDSGRLVPDDLIIAMVEERLARPDARRSWILDGFPRTSPQAEALDASLAERSAPLTHVVSFDVGDAVLVERLTGRRTCSKCGAIWNVAFQPTAREGLCDRCGGELVQRADDSRAAVEKRLAVYHEQTAPLLEHYRKRGVLLPIAADRPPQAVFEDLVTALESSP